MASDQVSDQRLTASKVKAHNFATVGTCPPTRDQRLTASKVKAQ